MIVRELPGALILDKPAGVATHTPDGGATEGFIEMASRLIGRSLWAIHRLDHDTSGCLLAALSEEIVAPWTQKLKEGKKKYVFISPKKSKDSVWSYQGRIEKVASHRFGIVAGEVNSFTTFAYLKPVPLGHLYEAEISTGKTHQIRIHAQNCGVPLLGDPFYGGEPFLRILLHAKELELDGEKYFSPIPRIFGFSPKESSDIGKFLVSLDRRRFLRNYLRETNAFRLVHREWATAKGHRLSVEKLGEVLQIMTYFGRDPDPSFASHLATITECSHWFVRRMFNRGDAEKNQNVTLISEDFPLQWVITENKMKFDLRYNQGLSSGLFLDQRTNRQQVLHSSGGKKVANLFSYTCGFSVAAALGGAHEVVSVDTSKTSLDWGKKNFELNGLNPEKYEFFSADALFFLNACMKRSRGFDLIIMDPPTFSRSKNGIFQLKEDLSDLLKMALQCLTPSGSLLITINDEEMTSEKLGREIEIAAQEIGFGPLLVKRASVPYDFEFPLERETVMKGFWVSKVN